MYGIITQHFGDIDVETDEEHGTTFSIYLPVDPVSETQTHVSEEYNPVQGRVETILLVEDDTPTRDAVRDSLEVLNYRVIEATNGLEALQVYDSPPEIDLVLTDIIMPEMGGRELIEKLTRDYRHARVVAMTGYALPEDLQALEEEMSIGILQKPLNVNSLSRTLSQVLDSNKTVE